MKFLKYVFITLSLLVCFNSYLSAQEMRYERVDFNIVDMTINAGIARDTIVRVQIEFSSLESSSSSFNGVGRFSISYAVGDTIWDAWPDQIMSDRIAGTGTLGFVSSESNIGDSGQDGVLPTGSSGRQRGTLAIESVEGGVIEEGDEYVMSITFKLN